MSEVQIPFDPIQRGIEIERIVMRGIKRLYYRFRPAQFYGGIATADAVGCCFLCAYCWNYQRNLDPGRYQEFFSPHEAAARLLTIAQKNNLNLYRISGAEPILGDRSFRHFKTITEVMFHYRSSTPFILETNGFFLGYQPDLIELLKYMNIKVRVSLKGIDPESFETLTGVRREFYKFPLIGLRELGRRGINAWPALMGDFFPKTDIRDFEKFLKDNCTKAPLEIENLKTFPFVTENLKQRKIEFF